MFASTFKIVTPAVVGASFSAFPNMNCPARRIYMTEPAGNDESSHSHSGSAPRFPGQSNVWPRASSAWIRGQDRHGRIDELAHRVLPAMSSTLYRRIRKRRAGTCKTNYRKAA